MQTTVKPIMSNNHENFEKLVETVNDFQNTFEEQSTGDREKLDDIKKAILALENLSEQKIATMNRVIESKFLEVFEKQTTILNEIKK